MNIHRDITQYIAKGFERDEVMRCISDKFRSVYNSRLCTDCQKWTDIHRVYVISLYSVLRWCVATGQLTKILPYTTLFDLGYFKYKGVSMWIPKSVKKTTWYKYITELKRQRKI